jgi:outer membrane protein OmpA-like peptidoglycan-associated protein
MKDPYGTGIVVLSALLMFACASTYTTPQLKDAQQAYIQARSDPTVAQYASAPLGEAANELHKAQNADSETQQVHYAYLATKRVELARSLAQEKAAEEELDKLRDKREEVLLQTRSFEAEEARKEALEARWETEQARDEIQRLREKMENLKAEQTENGIQLTFGDMLFATDRAALKPGAELSIQELAEYLKEHPEREIVIEGHTDSRGPKDYNRKLSRKRAEAVETALVAQGVRAGRMTTRGLGEAYPIAPNTTAAGRQENRRVEILIQKP